MKYILLIIAIMFYLLMVQVVREWRNIEQQWINLEEKRLIFDICMKDERISCDTKTTLL